MLTYADVSVEDDGRLLREAEVQRRPRLRLRHLRAAGYGMVLALGLGLGLDAATGGVVLHWLRAQGAAQGQWVATHESSYGR